MNTQATGEIRPKSTLLRASVISKCGPFTRQLGVFDNLPEALRDYGFPYDKNYTQAIFAELDSGAKEVKRISNKYGISFVIRPYITAWKLLAKFPENYPCCRFDFVVVNNQSRERRKIQDALIDFIVGLILLFIREKSNRFGYVTSQFSSKERKYTVSVVGACSSEMNRFAYADYFKSLFKKHGHSVRVTSYDVLGGVL